MSRTHGDGFGQIMAGGGTPVAYAPTVTWAGNTITTQSGFYLKTPGLLLVWVSFVESAGTAVAVLTISLPTGYTAVTHTGSLASSVGMVARATTIGANTALQAAAGALTQVITGATVTGAVDTWVAFMQIPTTT